MKNQLDSVCEILEKLRQKSPLVLALTNSVVQPITANLLLAVGAAPVMLNDSDECEDLLRSCANAMLINLGTLSKQQAETMRRAVATANTVQTPWVLDPVAVGLLRFRTEFAREILSLRPSVIRGNASEILALAGYDGKPRGPESTSASRDAVDAAKELAVETNAVVLVTGEIDYITDGVSVVALSNGHPMMTRVTGVGCAMGALTAACVAAAGSAFSGALASAAIMGLAGEIAFERAQAPGTFAATLLDVFYEISPETLRSHSKITIL